MPQTVALAAYVIKNNANPMHTRDLYTSPWFRKVVYAIERAWAVEQTKAIPAQLEG